jgi:hypothetical protein
MSDRSDIRTYREFWPFYLNEHSRPETRALHIAGTGLAIALLLAALIAANAWLAGIAVLAGYGPAWLAHFLVEKNRPATFRYPVWSLISDFRMAGTWLAGNLHRELKRARDANR